MRKLMILVAAVMGVGVAVAAIHSMPAVAREEMPAQVTEADVNAVIDARLHELLARKIAEVHARAELAAAEQ